MREIKMRGFSLELNDWVYGTYLDGYIVSGGVSEYNDYLAVDKYAAVVGGSAGQYTGLKDKNGREIYDGDIAKREFEISETIWGGSEEGNNLGPVGEKILAEGYFVGVVSQAPSGLYVLNKCKKYDMEGNFIKSCSHIKLHAHYASVIGNVFENPELLEVSQ